MKKNDSGIHLSFVIMILINLFCCWEKVFILTNTVYGLMGKV